MKIILVPTDFSKSARNALLYAAEMALNTNAKLILLNVYDSSLIAASSVKVPQLVPSFEVMQSAAKLELEKEKKRIETKYGGELVTEIEFKWGFTVEEINTYAEENNVDLIIMGMYGVDYFIERFLGSTTTMTLRKAVRPILIIGERMSYKPWNKMVLAVDGNETNYETVLMNVRKWMKLYHAQLYVLHISPSYVTEPAEEKGNLMELEDELGDTEHSLHFRTSNDVVGEINEFVREMDADLIVMIPREHSLLEGILAEANTKRMAFHTKVPLLSLHEKIK